jgi:hypothetical protein
MNHLMNPFRYGFSAVALISSRFLRWLTPLFLGTLFLANLFLLDKPIYQLAFSLQVGFYTMALATYLFQRWGFHPGAFFSIPLYFCLISGAAAMGLKRLLAGETGQIWETRR